MVKRILRHIGLHILFCLIATATLLPGTFIVGVRTTGDNPGALLTGIAVMLITYCGLVGLEALMRNGGLEKLARRRWLEALGAAVLACGTVILSALAIEFAFKTTMLTFIDLADPEKLWGLPALVFVAALLGYELLFLGLVELFRRGIASISSRWAPAS